MRHLLETATTIAMLVAAVTVTAVTLVRSFGSDRGPSPPPLPTEPVSIAGAPSSGNKAASVVLIEYSDFQCPFCKRFVSDTLPRLVKEYVDSGRVQFVFRHLPLEKLHPSAMAAAKAVVCADRQGQFWLMHDLLFQAERISSEGALEQATALGLDSATFAKCVNDEAEAVVRSDMTGAKSLTVNSTPTFFVGVRRADEDDINIVRRLDGAKPYEEFASALQHYLGQVSTR